MELIESGYESVEGRQRISEGVSFCQKKVFTSLLWMTNRGFQKHSLLFSAEWLYGNFLYRSIEALNRLLSGSPNVLLTDVVMPDLSGIDLAI